MIEDGPTGRRERKKLQTRRHIAGTAVRLFVQRGFDDVSVAEIAEAADVSKVTVFNYFPAKADMFFELAAAAMPDPASAVRDRGEGVSPVEAIRAYYLAALDRRQEWTGLHDGVDRFARVIWGSPTLTAAFAERTHQAEDALALELAGLAGETPWGLSPSMFDPGLPTAGSAGSERLAPPGPIGHRLVAAMTTTVLDQLIRANLARMIAGQSAAEAAPAARAEAELAFALLADGTRGYGVGGARGVAQKAQ